MSTMRLLLAAGEPRRNTGAQKAPTQCRRTLALLPSLLRIYRRPAIHERAICCFQARSGPPAARPASPADRPAVLTTARPLPVSSCLMGYPPTAPGCDPSERRAAPRAGVAMTNMALAPPFPPLPLVSRTPSPLPPGQAPSASCEAPSLTAFLTDSSRCAGGAVCWRAGFQRCCRRTPPHTACPPGRLWPRLCRCPRLCALPRGGSCSQVPRPVCSAAGAGEGP